MSAPNLRRDPRGSITGPIKLSWHDPARGLVYLRGRCVDASRTGMKIELNESIPKRASLAVSADRIGFSGSASVRHIARVGTKFILGLELSHPIPDSLLQKHVALPDAPVDANDLKTDKAQAAEPKTAKKADSPGKKDVA